MLTWRDGIGGKLNQVSQKGDWAPRIDRKRRRRRGETCSSSDEEDRASQMGSDLKRMTEDSLIIDGFL